MIERKLASIQKIVDIKPIENADKIEVAVVLGWECVVPKDQFRVGDLIVYFEIDSFIPYTEWSKFLWKGKEVNNPNEARYCLKTVKLRGQISQGLILPLSILSNEKDNVKEGDDVSDILNVTKYEPERFNDFQKNALPFPFFLSKTDEIRIQSIPNILDEIKGMNIYITEKLDGCSATYYLYDEMFGVCSRNLEIKENENDIYWQIAKKYDIENKLKKYLKTTDYKSIAIQGEIIGEGIQKNHLGIKGKELFIFNLYYIDTKCYASVSELINFCKVVELPIVPILEYNVNVSEEWNVNFLIEKAKGNSVLNTKAKREGIIIRPIIETYSNILKGRMSFKVINNDYLLDA